MLILFHFAGPVISPTLNVSRDDVDGGYYRNYSPRYQSKRAEQRFGRIRVTCFRQGVWYTANPFMCIGKLHSNTAWKHTLVSNNLAINQLNYLMSRQHVLRCVY